LEERERDAANRKSERDVRGTRREDEGPKYVCALD